jgi:hypothetical protein
MSLGAEIAKVEPADRFALHQAQGDRTRFSATDGLLANLAARCIRGEQVLGVTPGKSKISPDHIKILGLSAQDRDALEAGYGRAHHGERGAWYLPESERLLPGLVQVAWWAKEQPRFALHSADAERAGVALDSVDPILVWAFLQPLMEALYLPLKLRSGYWVGDRRPDQMAKDWAAVDHTYATLGIDATEPLAAFKDGRRWADLAGAEVIDLRNSLLRCWAEAPEGVGARALCWHIDRLLDRYYSKAKNGQAERSKVLNKTLERSLSAAFGGDWLALTAYAGEQVHASERISTSVESTAIVVPGQGAAHQAAEATGVSAAEIERILAAYWEGSTETPVDRRVGTMRQWWQAFDELHARQAPGMPSLWGVVSEGHEATAPRNDSDGVFNPGGYRRLGPEVCARVEELWPTEVLPRWPDHLVTQPYPHAGMAGALGPAVRFWQGVGLTCWFLCEGPFSRTDIAGMPSYYQREIQELEQDGFPIDRQLFTDLRQAENSLTERPETDEDHTSHDLGGGISFTVSMRIGPAKLDGFEHLRDVVTRYRRVWAEQHLESYLRHRWQSDLRRAGDEYHRHTADKGKAPTLKQFAKVAAEPANHWFAGRIDQVCSALQLPAPDPPVYQRHMPADAVGFVERLGAQMGGARWKDTPEEMSRDERTVMLRRFELAEEAIGVIRLWEAMDAAPTLKGQSRAARTLETAYGEDVEAGWAWYLQHIQAALMRNAT